MSQAEVGLGKRNLFHTIWPIPASAHNDKPNSKGKPASYQHRPAPMPEEGISTSPYS